MGSEIPALEHTLIRGLVELLPGRDGEMSAKDQAGWLALAQALLVVVYSEGEGGEGGIENSELGIVNEEGETAGGIENSELRMVNEEGERVGGKGETAGAPPAESRRRGGRAGKTVNGMALADMVMGVLREVSDNPGAESALSVKEIMEAAGKRWSLDGWSNPRGAFNYKVKQMEQAGHIQLAAELDGPARYRVGECDV